MPSPTSTLTGARLTAAALALCAAGTAVAEPERYEIDPDHFSIGFSIEHVGYADVLGMFLEGEGSFIYDEATRELSEGRVEIAADSVFTNHEERDGHVRGDDFLAVEDHPEIVFVAREYRPDGEDGGQLEGDLTLHGETHPVTLDVTINKSAEYPFGHGQHTLGVSASTRIERSRWGIDYGVANGMVGDTVELDFEFEAIRQ